MLASLITALCLVATDGIRVDEPITLHPKNPHYFQFRGKPTVLMTSGEHYGAVLNLDFDFIPYLDTLKRHGFNLTRTFSGVYREVPGSFGIENNTLAPKPNRYQAPWKKVADASGNTPERYNLDEFDPAYFERLKTFITEAGKRGVVVELVLFCPFYEENLWEANPMNAKNNTNNVGNCPREEVYSLRHDDLTQRQLDYVRKVVKELNEFDNLYYEICNEPYFGGVTLDWQRKVAETIVATEEDLPKEHLIAQNIANEKTKVDQPVHNAVAILNFHYAKVDASIENQGLDRVIGDDETGFKGHADRAYRTEAWLFLLSGGAVYSNLDYSYTPDHENGTASVRDPTPGGGGESLRKQLSFLKKFLDGFDLLEMQPAIVKPEAGNTPDVHMAVLAAQGEQYAVYLDAGKGRAIVRFDMPRGKYVGAWYDPRTGDEIRKAEVDHRGGTVTLNSPVYKEDIALKLVKADGPQPCAEPMPPPAPPRLKVSDNHRFLMLEEKRPFFYLGDTAWELFHRLDREEAVAYLDNRSKKGFTVIQAVVLAEFDGLGKPNAYRATPLKDNDPTKPNEDYFKHVDYIVDQAAQRGLYIGMLPTWGDKVNKKWGVGPEIFTSENARVYGEFLGKRYRDKPIIWILGGDRPVENDTHRAIWPAMAEGLRAGDGGTHLITYHPSGGGSSADFYADAPWIDFHMIQSGHAARDIASYDMIAKEYKRTPVKPVVDGEPRYEDHPINWDPKNGWFDDYDVRKAAYWSVFAGACGVTYGCHDIWQFWQPGRDPVSHARTDWHKAIDLPASKQMKYLKTLIEEHSYFDRVPDQSLIVGDAGKGGDHAQACRGSGYALVYIPTRREVTIDTGKLRGDRLMSAWLDPRTGEQSPWVSVMGDGPKFTPPKGGPDWVLVLENRATR